ncbi:alpha/beta hydrolase family protein [Spelaeicoccus albus]|nr:alpha/beta fold hydrolase [Spelaeicoccus albus]
MKRTPSKPARTPWVFLGIGAGASLAAVLSAATSGLAAYFARRIVVPERAEEPLEILHVSGFDGEMSILLAADDETMVPGRYGLVFDGGRGHARIGDILEYDPRAGTVLRSVLGVDAGTLRKARRGRWSAAYYRNPDAAGVPSTEITMHSDAGELPAWCIPGNPSAVEGFTDVWAILIHGRGGTRAAGLSAVRPLRRLGITSLAIAYRNDAEVQPPDDSRYGLGDTEWLDVDAAIEYALDHGARRIVLFGWSMGGAIAFQSASRSRFKSAISALVLDAPVVDWFAVLDRQAKINKLPTPVARLSLSMISRPWARWITGLETPLDLHRMDWVTRAAELDKPVLLIHSDDDDFVPSRPSHLLARARSDLVTMPVYDTARHTKEWNVDPERWDDDVARFLSGVLSRPGSRGD